MLLRSMNFDLYIEFLLQYILNNKINTTGAHIKKLTCSMTALPSIVSENRPRRFEEYCLCNVVRARLTTSAWMKHSSASLLSIYVFLIFQHKFACHTTLCHHIYLKYFSVQILYRKK